MEQAVLERRVRVIPATKPAPASGPRHSGRQRVAAYCRVSTDSEEQLNSYAAQQNYYTQKIEENPDWEMAGIFADEGLSGTSMKKRTEFNRMIAACKRGRIDMILTKSASRFARNTVDCLKVIRALKARGIAVIFEKENINTLTESSEFLITLFSSFSQAESESMSLNIIPGIRQSMKEGNIPFQYSRTLGYRKGPDGRPEIDPDEAETVRLIYTRYLEGRSLGDIQRELVEKNIPTAAGIQGWSRQVIQNILTSEKFIGVPIASLLLRRTALRFREEPELVAQYSEQVQETSVQRKRGLLELPALFSRPSVYLAKLGMVAVAACYTAKLTNGAVHYFVLCLVMGALFFALGFLEKGILAKTQSGGLITFFVTILIFSNLATTTPQQVVSVLVPLLAAAVLGVAGTVAVGFVAGKLLKVPFGLAVSLGISCTFGFPTTMLIPQEVSEAIGRNDREKAAILNYLLPKMLTAGFVTVTIASVLIAGFVVNML